MQAYTNSGVIGYPPRDTAEKRKKVINHLGQAAQSLTTLLISQSTSSPYRGGYRPLTLPSAATKSGDSS
jgi:hypothetical protein